MTEDTPELKKNEKLEKIKETIKNNWKPFTVGVVLTGATLIVARRVCLHNITLEGMKASNVGVINYKIDQSITAVTLRSEIGRPPYLIHDKTTDLYYGSQTAIANVLNASNSTVSRHLNGLRDHVSGHILERIYPET